MCTILKCRLTNLKQRLTSSPKLYTPSPSMAANPRLNALSTCSGTAQYQSKNNYLSIIVVRFFNILIKAHLFTLC